VSFSGACMPARQSVDVKMCFNLAWNHLPNPEKFNEYENLPHRSQRCTGTEEILQNLLYCFQAMGGIVRVGEVKQMGVLGKVGDISERLELWKEQQMVTGGEPRGGRSNGGK